MDPIYNSEISERLERIKRKSQKRKLKPKNIDEETNSQPPATTGTIQQKPVVQRRTQKTNKKIKKPKTKTIAIATKQLASMVKTGLPIVEALSLVAETTDDKSIKIAFADISMGIGKGNTIVSMMEKYPQIFDEMYLALADAGEQAGLLAEVLEREALLLESLAKLQGQIKSAMTYPIAISLLVVIVVIIMLVCDTSFCRYVPRLGCRSPDTYTITSRCIRLVEKFSKCLGSHFSSFCSIHCDKKTI